MLTIFLSKGFKGTCESSESRIKGAASTNSEVYITTLMTMAYLNGHYSEVMVDEELQKIKSPKRPLLI